MQNYEELFKIADRLDSLAAKGEDAAVKQPLAKIEEVAEKVGKAFSGSWLGYHANVYYENFQAPPPGAHFSQEWGLCDAFGNETTGNWREYNSDEVKAYIISRSGNHKLDALMSGAGEAAAEFDKDKAAIESILSIVLNNRADGFLQQQLDKLKKIKRRSFVA